MESNLTVEEISASIRNLLSTLTQAQCIEAINQVKSTLHEFSPFKNEPVDCVLWMKTGQLISNDYNPNNVATAEKSLLKTSLIQDGFTHPIVATQEPRTNNFVIIDGFHRFELSRKKGELNDRLHGYVPVVLMPQASNDKSRRMAEIVRELSHLGWDDKKISHELGMDADEVLRLKQVCGLFELFGNRKFSKAWTVK